MLRLKFGPMEAKRMNVIVDATVSAAVRNALVEGDWVKVISSAAAAGQPLGAGGVELRVVPVDGTAHRLSFPLWNNPQQPDSTVPGVGLTALVDGVRFAYTDRYDTGLATNLYADVPLLAKSFTVSGVTRYGLVPGDPAVLGDVVAAVAWGVGVFNSELCFRML